MLILAAVLAIFVYGMIAAMLGTILPDLSRRFNLTPSQNGTIALAQALGLILASLLTGPLLDTQGEKIGLVLGLALIVIALFSLPRVKGFATILVLLLLLGAGGGIVVTGANALVSAVSSDHRATALNLVNLFFGLGGFATPFLSANLFSRNWVRLCYAVASLTSIALLVQVIPAMPKPSGQGGFPMAQVGPILGNPLLYLLGLFLFLYISCEVGVWNWLPRHLIARGVPQEKALNILSLGFALGMLVGRMVVSPVLMRVPAVTVILAASVAMAFTTFFMLRASRPATAFAVVFLAGVSMAPVFPTVLAIAGSAFPVLGATAMGVVITCGWIGLAVSSRIIGAVAGEKPERLGKALLLIPASSVLMIFLSFGIASALR